MVVVADLLAAMLNHSNSSSAHTLISPTTIIPELQMTAKRHLFGATAVGSLTLLLCGECSKKRIWLKVA